ncbi:MarR family transcriptional regulator [Komagataeibacter sp. NFXK3]
MAKSSQPNQAHADQMTHSLRDTVVAMVRRDGPDLSARQLAVFLTCYLSDSAHTVRGLAAELNVSKPAITRALDRLEDLRLARRTADPMDRRSVLITHTPQGNGFLRDLRTIVNETSAAAQEKVAAPVRKAPRARRTEELRRAS